MKTISELSDREILELLLASQAQMQADILLIMSKVGVPFAETLKGGNVAQEYVKMNTYLKNLKESTILG